MNFKIILYLLIITIFQFSLAEESKLYEVTRVVDGDTLDLETIGRVRLIGVDTPETVHPKKPVEYFGKEASKFLKDLVDGRKVKIEYDQANAVKNNLDKYERTLGYIYLEDGTFVNAAIIEKGYGHAYTSFPFKHLDRFRSLEKEARETKRGLWADAKPELKSEKPKTKEGDYSCEVRKTCKQIKTCKEAMYLLNECGFSRLDGDKDGIPCEKLCDKN